MSEIKRVETITDVYSYKLINKEGKVMRQKTGKQYKLDTCCPGCFGGIYAIDWDKRTYTFYEQTYALWAKEMAKYNYDVRLIAPDLVQLVDMGFYTVEEEKFEDAEEDELFEFVEDV